MSLTQTTLAADDQENSIEKSPIERDYTNPGDGLEINRVGTQYTDKGVRILKENNAGGVWTCSWDIVEWGTAEKIQWCDYCGKAYSAHSYPGACFGCAVGVTR